MKYHSILIMDITLENQCCYVNSLLKENEMKSYVCELCNGTQFAKSEGFFVCQQCGISYSVDEMKKLLSTSSDESKSVMDVPHNQSEEPVVVNASASTESNEENENNVPKSKNAAESETAVTERANISSMSKAKSNNSSVNTGLNKKCKSWLKKIKLKHILLGSFAIFIVVFFIISLIKAMDTSNYEGNNMLIASGASELLIAFILYKVMIHIERYNCPKCAAKRVHHRCYLRTSEVDKDFNNQGGHTYKTIYTHHYEDTYECPSCGETRTENIKKSGGEYTELGNGRIIDTRKPPKEF